MARYNVNRYYKGNWEAIEFNTDSFEIAEEELAFLEENAAPGEEFVIEEV